MVFLVVRLIQSYAKPGASGYSKSNSSFNKKEGEVSVDKKSTDKKKIISKNEGEYIDYEDV